MARLYADENVPLPVVDELRALRHDIPTIVEDGKGNQARIPRSSWRLLTCDRPRGCRVSGAMALAKGIGSTVRRTRAPARDGQASVQDLESWAENVLDARTLDEVFDSIH